MFKRILKTRRFKKVVLSRYKKILKIYCEKDFSKYKTYEDKKMLLEAFVWEFVICLKKGVLEYLKMK